MDQFRRRQAKIFCDFNGTVTDRDALVALLEFSGRGELAEQIARARREGSLTLRRRIALEAMFLTCTLEEATERLASITSYDETFTRFVQQCARQAVPLCIVTSGLEPLVADVLSRHGIRDVPIVANGVDARAKGWHVQFRDTTPEGNAKLPYVRDAQRDGFCAVAIGDDESDFEMASQADIRFAKRESVLDRYLQETHHPYYAFETFDDVFERLVWEKVLDD